MSAPRIPAPRDRIDLPLNPPAGSYEIDLPLVTAADDRFTVFEEASAFVPRARASRKVRWLRHLEHALLATGLAFGTWCAAVLWDGYRVSQMPIPEPSAAKETGSPAPITLPRGAWVARLSAPSVKLAATILEGSDDATLLRGAGHIEMTAMPGQPGNVGIAGHRDTTFRAVKNLRDGDPLELTTADRVYRYRVARTFIVRPEDVYVLEPGKEPMLTLVTCYPFEFVGNAPQRFIVQAVLEDQQPRPTAAALPTIP